MLSCCWSGFPSCRQEAPFSPCWRFPSDCRFWPSATPLTPTFSWLLSLQASPSLPQAGNSGTSSNKGFAFVVYGLIVLESGIGLADQVFHLIALVIVLSILAHSLTDVVIARQFDPPHVNKP